VVVTATPVLVVEADDAVRAQVRRALDDSEFSVCCEVRSAASGLARLETCSAPLVLIGTNLAGDVRGTVRRIRRAGDADVVVLLHDIDDPALADLVLAGASGAVPLDALHTLPPALAGVLRDEPALPRRLVGQLLEEYRAREDARRGRHRLLGRLSPREVEILELLRRGLSTQEVARELVVTPVTVRSHIASAVRKLHVADRDAAVRLLATENGTLDGVEEGRVTPPSG
jgi:DNA-binding NarL/FixJ family response regulator